MNECIEHLRNVNHEAVKKAVDDQWMPTFSNAEYLFSEIEWDYWKTEKQSYGPVIEDSITPIFDAKMARLVKSDHRISDEVSLFS